MTELLTRKHYSSDLDDAEWTLIEPLLPPLIEKGWGAPCRWHRRDVIDAIFYVLKTGCPWRDLPGDFPPWNTVWKWFQRWRKDGTWVTVHDTLRAKTREAAQRDAEPSMVLIDSQTVKGTEYSTPQRAPAVVDAAAVFAALTTPDDPAAAGVTVEQIAEAVLGPNHGVPAEHVPAVVAAAILGVGEASARPFPKARVRVGYDGGKKVKGRKRHLLVDTQGLVQSVVVHGADAHDSVGAVLVLARRVGSARRLEKILADMAYQGPLGAWVFELSGVTLEIVKRAEEVKGFAVQKWRWIVERTHAWLGRFRRLTRCFERLAETDETMVHVAMTRLMLRRIAHPERKTWRNTIAFAE
jgi:putative transposase